MVQGSTRVNDSLLVLPGPILFTTAAGTSQSDISTDLLETVLKSKLIETLIATMSRS